MDSKKDSSKRSLKQCFKYERIIDDKSYKFEFEDGFSLALALEFVFDVTDFLFKQIEAAKNNQVKALDKSKADSSKEKAEEKE